MIVRNLHKIKDGIIFFSILNNQYKVEIDYSLILQYYEKKSTKCKMVIYISLMINLLYKKNIYGKRKFTFNYL